MTVKYGYRVRWDNGNECEVGGLASFEEAKDRAWRFAATLGYTLPRWWQFWRWKEAWPPDNLRIELFETRK